MILNVLEYLHLPALAAVAWWLDRRMVRLEGAILKKGRER